MTKNGQSVIKGSKDSLLNKDILMMYLPFWVILLITKKLYWLYQKVMETSYILITNHLCQSSQPLAILVIGFNQTGSLYQS